ncbi:MAG: azurin [Planctomycetaceae bacterium]|nr:azurin [Planctomycetaceae bacterium]
MQHQNYWETQLHQRFPRHNLTVRNLCLPGDEPLNRLRSLNFGEPDQHLKHSRADVVLYFFGFNESFQGEAGLASFTADLTKVVNDTKAQDYSGKGSPRIVLVSPIAFENTGDKNLPDGSEHNPRLAAYTEAIRDVAKETGVVFANIFAPTKQLFEKSDARYTLDGAHLKTKGYQELGSIMNAALFGPDQAPATFDLAIKAEVDDKNFHWWHRYRAVNGYSIWGKRGKAGTDGTYNNTDVMERERAILDQMTANRDARIWQLAQDKKVAEKANDSNTLPFIQPKTNVGGDNDPNREKGKLGSLDYRPAAEQQKYFKLADGYEINLVASEEDFPELANPVSMNFDNKGRLWVSTMPSYPHWKPKSKMDDKLLILEDKDSDGRADECKVFAGGLHQPTGFELGRGGVWVAQQPDILFLKDTDGDDKEDVRIRQIIGLDTADSHHGPAAFEWGPGGGLYFAEGTFKQSQIESPYGLNRLGDAGVWRYDPRTAKTDVHVSLSFANPWGHVFDRWGQNFIADASPGFNYWAAPIGGVVQHPDKHPGGCRDKGLDFGGPKVKGTYPTFIKKRIRPSSGCEFVSSRHFPPEAQGNFLQNNVIGDRAVLQFSVKEQDSGYTGEELPPIVACDDGNFRPVDLQLGPDGALYIVDWHNALIGHLQHNLREPNRDHSHGRIWRVTYKGRPLVKAPKIAGESIEKLLDLLKEPEDRTRYRVRRELAERDSEQVVAATRKWVAKLDSADENYELYRLEALWIHQTHNIVDEALLTNVLNSEDYHARAAATRVLCYWRDQVKEPVAQLKKRINDPHPRVRVEALRACSFLPAEEVQEAALDALNYDMDTYLEYTLDETMRHLDSQG